MSYTLGKAYLVTSRAFTSGSPTLYYTRTLVEGENIVAAIEEDSISMQEWRKPKITGPIQIDVVIKDIDYVIPVRDGDFVEFYDIKIVRETIENQESLDILKSLTLEDIKKLKEILPKEALPIIQKHKEDVSAAEAAKL